MTFLKDGLSVHAFAVVERLEAVANSAERKPVASLTVLCQRERPAYDPLVPAKLLHTMEKPVRVEDNHSDVFLIREALDAAGVVADVQVIHDGSRALQYFENSDGQEGFDDEFMKLGFVVKALLGKESKA